MGGSTRRQKRTGIKHSQQRLRTRPLRTIWRILTQRFTIMLIPHSERGVINFHINVLVLIFAFGVFGTVLGGFIYLSSIHVGTTAIVEEQETLLRILRRILMPS